MPLSENEQRLLEQIERALYDEDPKFANKVQNTTPRTQTARKILRSVIIVVAGLAVVVIGVSTKLVPLGILGFAVMLFGGVLLLRGGQKPAPTGNAAAPDSEGKAKGSGAVGESLGGKMEDRWRRRWEDRE